MKTQANVFPIAVCMLIAFLLLATSARPEGEVEFSNLSYAGVDAPVTAYPSGLLLSGSNYLAGLYARRADSSPESFQLLPPVKEFGTNDSAGYISRRGPTTRLVPVAPGQIAIFQVRVWSALGGRTYEEAVAAKLTNSAIAYGKSESIAVKLGGVPHPSHSHSFSVPLIGLRGFSINVTP